MKPISNINLAIDNKNDLEKFIEYNNTFEDNNLNLKKIIDFYSKYE